MTNPPLIRGNALTHLSSQDDTEKLVGGGIALGYDPTDRLADI